MTTRTTLTRRRRRGFGSVRRLPSKRWQAMYSGPDLGRHSAPFTFDTRLACEAWLVNEHRLIAGGTWTPPSTRTAVRRARTATLAEYGPAAITRRRVRGGPLKPRTSALYRGQFARLIAPDLGHLSLGEITPTLVSRWYDDLDPSKPTQRAHAYSLLRTLLGQAVEEGLLVANPCHIRGAGRVSRAAHDVRVATPDEIDTIAAAMPPRLAALVQIAAWCGLRFGELAELRRHDIDIERGIVSVSRGVTRVDGRDVVSTPKSFAGIRTVTIPPHVVPLIVEHLAEFVGPGPEALLFPRASDPSLHAIHTEVTKRFAHARSVAGRDDLHLHDLRHTGATLAAQAGATLAELMTRMGHSTPTAAIRYQHAAQGRDAEIAARMSAQRQG